VVTGKTPKVVTGKIPVTGKTQNTSTGKEAKKVASTYGDKENQGYLEISPGNVRNLQLCPLEWDRVDRKKVNLERPLNIPRTESPLFGDKRTL
jgi:hypothetical protein